MTGHDGPKYAIKPAIEGNAGLVKQEQALAAAFEKWWKAHGPRITALAGKQDGAASLMALRNDLLESFSESLESVGMLDPFQVRGIIAGFWNDTKYEFLTLMARGSRGVLDAWRTSILTTLEDGESKDNPLDHKLVKFLLGEFVDALAELEAKKAELDSQIKAATASSAEEDEDGAGDSNEGDDENAVDEAQLKAWKKDLTDIKKKIKAQNEAFAAKLNKAVDGLTQQQADDLLLTILHNDMKAIVGRYVSAQRKQVVAAFENWWDKYRVTLTDIEGKRDTAAKELQGFLKGLGYV